MASLPQQIEEGNAPFGIEDLQYYVKRYEEQRFDLDFSEIKKYFPLEVVLSGIFKIYEDMFGKGWNFLLCETWICQWIPFWRLTYFFYVQE